MKRSILLLRTIYFCDERVAIAQIKDNLSEALALVSNQETLIAFESILVNKCKSSVIVSALREQGLGSKQLDDGIHQSK